MYPIIYIPICFLLCFVRCVFCWQFYTSLVDYTLSNSYKVPAPVHSEYQFGDCKKGSGLKLYTRVHLDHLEVLGKVIVRGWIDINRIPTCIVLRATAWEEDVFRSTSYNFQMCVPRITYCHSQHRYKYYYYEWYIPSDYIGGMNWDIFFFGPQELAW